VTLVAAYIAVRHHTVFVWHELDGYSQQAEQLLTAKWPRDVYRPALYVILTALGGSAPETAARQVGANYFMTQPFSPRELAAKVEELLASHASAADPGEAAGSTGENPMEQPET